MKKPKKNPIKLQQAPAGGITAYSRWGTWEDQVLNCVNQPARVQELVARRRAAMDDDEETTNIVADYIRSKLESIRLDPDTSVVFIFNQQMFGWLIQATNEHQTSNKASTTLDGLGIPELKRRRLAKNRGWIWRGKSAAKSAKVIIYPCAEASQRRGIGG
jgi:hypothetical protein